MKDGSWCRINSVGEIDYLDWEYIELRAALHRKRTQGKTLHAHMDENMEGIVACFAIAVREQVLRSKVPDDPKKTQG